MRGFASLPSTCLSKSALYWCSMCARQRCALVGVVRYRALVTLRIDLEVAVGRLEPCVRTVEVTERGRALLEDFKSGRFRKAKFPLSDESGDHRTAIPKQRQPDHPGQAPNCTPPKEGLSGRKTGSTIAARAPEHACQERRSFRVPGTADLAQHPQCPHILVRRLHPASRLPGARRAISRMAAATLPTVAEKRGGSGWTPVQGGGAAPPVVA